MIRQKNLKQHCQGGGKKARKGSIAEHEKVMKFLERQRDRERDSGGV